MVRGGRGPRTRIILALINEPAGRLANLPTPPPLRLLAARTTQQQQQRVRSDGMHGARESETAADAEATFAAGASRSKCRRRRRRRSRSQKQQQRSTTGARPKHKTPLEALKQKEKKWARGDERRRGWFAAAAMGLIGFAARQRRRAAAAAADGDGDSSPPTTGVTSSLGPHWPPRRITARAGRWPKSPAVHAAATAQRAATPYLPPSAPAAAKLLAGGRQVSTVTGALSHAAAPRYWRAARAPPPVAPAAAAAAAPPVVIHWDATSPTAGVGGGGRLRCISSKKSLILLSCIAAAIVLVCGGMVVTAYVSWKHRREVTAVHVSVGSPPSSAAGDHASPLDHGRRPPLPSLPAGSSGNPSSERSGSERAAGGQHNATGISSSSRAALEDAIRLRACADRRLQELKRSQEETRLSVSSSDDYRGGSHRSHRNDADDTTGTDDEDGMVSSGSGDGPTATGDNDAASRRPENRAGQRAHQIVWNDACERALRCNHDPYLEEYIRRLADLPSCPCVYPEPTPRSSGSEGIVIDGIETSRMEVWDSVHHRSFYWKPAHYTPHQLSVYHNTARRCIWSVASPSNGTLASQSCCYNAHSKLITRGPGAGTPMLVSPDISPQLNYALDRLPWVMCGGDWTRFNHVRRPNNARKCHEFPNEIEYLYLALRAKDT